MALIWNSLIDSSGGFDTVPDYYVYLKMANTVGIASWSLTCIGTDDQSDPPTISDDGYGVKSFRASDNVRGAAYVFESVVTTSIGNTVTSRFGVFAIGDSGNRLVAYQQSSEGSTKLGFTKDLNTAITVDGYISADFDGYISTTKAIYVKELTCNTLDIGGDFSLGSITISQTASDNNYQPDISIHKSLFFVGDDGTTFSRYFSLPNAIDGYAGLAWTIVNTSSTNSLWINVLGSPYRYIDCGEGETFYLIPDNDYDSSYTATWIGNDIEPAM